MQIKKASVLSYPEILKIRSYGKRGQELVTLHLLMLSLTRKDLKQTWSLIQFTNRLSPNHTQTKMVIFKLVILNNLSHGESAFSYMMFLLAANLFWQDLHNTVLFKIVHSTEHSLKCLNARNWPQLL